MYWPLGYGERLCKDLTARRGGRQTMRSIDFPRRRQGGSATPGLLLLGLALAVGLVLSASIVSRSLERIKLAGDRIRVKGYAEERVISDAGTWRGTVSVRASDLRDGYRRLEADTASILERLQALGGEAASPSVSPATTRVIYEVGPQGQQTSRVSAYELDRNFEISSSDVALISRLANGASSLISEGVQINSWPPQYFYGNLNEVKVRLIGAAMRDSLLRAQQFADNSGVTVGPLRSASQGVFQITRPNSTETEDYGSYDTSTVEKVVKAVVTAEYSVERE
jgi:hypothetical protein